MTQISLIEGVTAVASATLCRRPGKFAEHMSYASDLENRIYREGD